MAIVRELQDKEITGNGSHTEVDATVSLIEANGEKFVQIDTYGSKIRAMPGKVSQSLRLSQTAFERLLQIGQKHFR